MSLYDVTVNSTGIGRAGTSKCIVIAFYPHMKEAREGITQWAAETFAGPIDVKIDFISHSNTIFPADVLQYERIVIIE